MLHHGTLLVRSDLEKMSRWLQPSTTAADSRAVRSRPAKVMNLSELKPSLTIEQAAAALIANCGESVEEAGETFLNRDAIQPLREKYASREWVFGR